MKSPKIFKSLTLLILASFVLSAASPVSQAQRRRTRTRAHARTPERARAAAPGSNLETTQPAPSSSTRPVVNVGKLPTASDTAEAPSASDSEAGQRAPESDQTIEELVGADTYGAYVELRRLGTLAHTPELKTAIAGMKLLGDADTKPVTDLMEFVSENYEPLAEARAVVLFMAARPRVPEAMLALEFQTPQEAAAFEPKYRQFADAQLKSYMGAKGPKETTARSAPSRPRVQQKPETKPDTPDYSIKRVGRLLITSEKTFSLKRLRGEVTAPALADSPRFQSARTRFSADSLFAYVDTGVTMQGFTRATQEAEGTQGGAATTGATATIKGEQKVEEAETVAPEIAEPKGYAEVKPSSESTPEVTTEPEEAEGEGERTTTFLTPEVAKPSEEQVAVSEMGNVMRSLWGGMPRIPGAFALGLRLDNGAVALRVAVENSPDGRINIIPFLPNLIAGPPVTAEAAEVAPADADIFFTTSLDWEQVYTSTIGTASLGPLGAVSMNPMSPTSVTDIPEGFMGDEVKPPKPEEAVAVIEKLFGFKFKEDLIPSLGNEIAISMPLDANDLGLVPGRRRSRRKEEEKDSEPGTVVIVALNDPDKIQKILPRVLVALGFLPFRDVAAQVEKREGFEIHTAGSMTYTVINRFLVFGDLKPVRHVIDSYAARHTLAATDNYRDSTGWQAPQKLVQAFVSNSLMRSMIEETKRRSGESTDPLVRTLLTQLEAPAESASFETTNEGDAVVHEIHVPVSMLQAYSLAMVVGVRDAPVLTGETSVMYTLYELQDAENTFKVEKKKERFGTLEEIVAEKILEKGFADHTGYQLELSAAGEKFEVTATPKEYGKSGRLSFFIDETGTLRAADHKGKPANVSDPPID